MSPLRMLFYFLYRRGGKGANFSMVTPKTMCLLVKLFARTARVVAAVPVLLFALILSSSVQILTTMIHRLDLHPLFKHLKRSAGGQLPCLFARRERGRKLNLIQQKSGDFFFAERRISSDWRVDSGGSGTRFLQHLLANMPSKKSILFGKQCSGGGGTL